jgi:hypothetical protein
MRVWILRAGAILLGGMILWALLGALSGYGHDPNRGIDLEKAREAANRVHPRPRPGEKRVPGHGG